MRRLRPFVGILTLVLLAGCAFPGVYERKIQQGHILDQEVLAQLKIGMQPQQVEYLLGSPLLPVQTQPLRWDYVYTLRQGNTWLENQRLTLYFGPQGLTKMETQGLD
ncbi:outer membrane protein assembly factor BamE [Allopseudospirillum japonicum]|uniref:Outer membrane protein assembly factor BamE n=1 Tax=Allopseudospirillum japonicum TaxID=64971 RepID=A0A1H6R5F5_9GAMM|nr:outer membrane protein assembly factor BamE [Allopseudospirillum japonicum]SEI46432.1 outer membrane protein assembly factor BamE [Allopseudospirillum japonicum]